LESFQHRINLNLPVMIAVYIQSDTPNLAKPALTTSGAVPADTFSYSVISGLLTP
jgi:hypothetical protein